MYPGRRVQYIARVSYGMGQPPPLSPDGVPIIRATNIFQGKISTKNLQRARLVDLPLERAPLLQQGEILLVRSGAYTGDSAIVTENWAGSAPGYDLRITPNPTVVEPRFLAWCFLSNYAKGQFDLKKLRAAQAHLNAAEVAAVKVPLPPLDVQRRVAKLLDEETARIDALVDRNERARRLALRRRDESIARAVTEGVPPGQCQASALAWAPAIASGFAVAPYQYVARIGTGHTPARSDPSLWMDCDIPWITTGDVGRLRPGRIETLTETAMSISRIGLANSAAVLHPAGTVVLSRTASVGFSAVMGTDMATSQDFFAWTCGPKLRPAYLLYVLRAMKSRGHFERLMYGSTHKTIYFPDLMELRGPLPPVEQQDRIIGHCREVIDHAMRIDEQMLRMSDLLRTRRQALITAAVTGQIDV